MTRIVRHWRTLLVVAGLVSVWGCTGKYSMSSYARTGDTVMIAINGEQETLFLRREDLTARITDSANVTRTVTVRAVVNIYPDPTSRLGAEKADVADYLGSRTAVIDLVDPVTGLPPELALGSAKLQLRRTGNILVVQDILLEILDGSGTLNPLVENVFGLSYVAALEPRPQVRYRIKPKAGVATPDLSGIEFELRIPESQLAGVPNTSLPQAIQTAADQHVRFSARHYSDDGFHVVRAIMVNPNGISNATLTPAQGYAGMSQYSTLRLAVAYGDALRATSYPPETLARTVVSGAAATMRVFDVTGADVTANFSLLVE